jgi:hypothetical protein
MNTCNQKSAPNKLSFKTSSKFPSNTFLSKLLSKNKPHKIKQTKKPQTFAEIRKCVTNARKVMDGRLSPTLLRIRHGLSMLKEKSSGGF